MYVLCDPEIPEYFLLVLILLEVDGDGFASPDVGAGVGALHAEYAHIPTNQALILH
jgi:hypothetical protein